MELWLCVISMAIFCKLMIAAVTDLSVCVLSCCFLVGSYFDPLFF